MDQPSGRTAGMTAAGPAVIYAADSAGAGVSFSMSLYVAGIWRYPVKTLAGERLRDARMGPFGIPGDRIVWVRGPEGVRTSRRLVPLL